MAWVYVHNSRIYIHDEARLNVQASKSVLEETLTAAKLAELIFFTTSYARTWLGHPHTHTRTHTYADVTSPVVCVNISSHDPLAYERTSRG